MNVPAIAKKTFDELFRKPEFAGIVNLVVEELSCLTSKLKRARLGHQLIEELNQEIFSHPLVQQLSPCRKGCSACCHTQVSITDDEAELLFHRIQQGVEIDEKRLRLQMSAKDQAEAFFKLPYDQRKCVFLDDEGGCRIYEDRPSVCRTNLVLGDPSQCDTSVKVKPTRLVKTPKSDMVIYALFLKAENSGALPHLLGKRLNL